MYSTTKNYTLYKDVVFLLYEDGLSQYKDDFIILVVRTVYPSYSLRTVYPSYKDGLS